jgi:hypothetical protein
LGSLGKLLSLDRGSRALLFHALVLVVLIRVALWLLPFRTVHGAVAARARRHEPAQQEHPVQRIVWAISAASRRVPRATCLTQAFAGTLLLAANGYAATPRLGVAKEADGRLRAHAWVECGGETILGDARIGAFVALPPLAVRG